MSQPFKYTIEENKDGRFEWVLVSVYKRAIKSGWANSRDEATTAANKAWDDAIAANTAPTPPNLHAFTL